ncbi:UDP-glucose 4-epimerase GalE [Aliihoeflea aestuarii]|uniref:UDP-glucose 4-epimerase GalE n=1 Tax=Aliihoeflea aestuarii TaxID=453840 RepID=UPI0020944844|nr:UDP-glucose 4-epimerase GalE [Aliihoeflea aestuarii]MCO6392594.1 UDP-glucose 4-epimerase GalE [Aliihoeflea aestuarii]
MTVLVTGGAGYIGSHMVWKLVEAGENVVVIDNLSTGFDWVLPLDVALIIGDIGDDRLVDRVMSEHGVDAVIHFAGSIVVPDSVADPLGYYLNNTVKSRSLIAAAVRNGVANFIFSSTAAVYGSPGEARLSEDTPALPESPYGTSKLMTELMLRDAAAAHDIRYTALRYFNVAGADPNGRTGQSSRGATHLIKVAAEAAIGKRRHIDIFGTDYATPDGTCIRDYIHVSDLVNAHYLALRRLRDGGESLIANCGYGRGYSVHEVIEAVKRVSGVNFPVHVAGRRPGDAVTVVANADRARRQFGWQPEHDDLELIVNHALAWEESLARRNIAVASR